MFSGNIKHLFELSNKLLVLSPKWIEWINEAYRGNKYNI
ncbi:putative glycosyltransferase domain protein, partial [Bacteroides fragilis str. 3998T(B)3]